MRVNGQRPLWGLRVDVQPAVMAMPIASAIMALLNRLRREGGGVMRGAGVEGWIAFMTKVERMFAIWPNRRNFVEH